MARYRVEFTAWAPVSTVSVEVEGAEDEWTALLGASAMARHCLAAEGMGETVILCDGCLALADEDMVRDVLAEALRDEGGEARD